MIDINENTQQKLTDVNADLAIFLPHDLSDMERAELFEKFGQVRIMLSPKPEDVFTVLYNYFNENEFSQYFIEKYRDTYWSVFVKLGWQILSKLNDDVFANFVARTLPFATSEYIDIKDKLLTELFSLEPLAAQSLYEKIKKIVFSLDYSVTFSEDGKSITLPVLIKQVINHQESEDLVKKSLFPDAENDVEQIKNSATIYTKDFIGILRFFAITPEDVSEYAGDYIRNRPENKDIELDKGLYGELGANLLEEYVADEVGEETEKIQSRTNEISLNFLIELPKHKTDFIGWVTNATVLRSLLIWLGTFENKTDARKELAKQMETVLGNDSLANNDLVLAIAHLDEFLIKNGYSGDDFFHFEESDGTFKWGK